MGYVLEESALDNSALRYWLSHLDKDAPISSNQPSLELPFQRWFKFKEAFSPALVVEVIQGAKKPPATCIDPFGGCGTTGLTCQFAGIRPTLIEVNPFIADLAEAKLSSYDLDGLQQDYIALRRHVRKHSVTRPRLYLQGAPVTMCEPGEGARWIFDEKVLGRILSYRKAIESLRNAKHQRLFRIILGSLLLECSNVVVNGKGRRYRENWQNRTVRTTDVDTHFESSFLAAVADLQQFSRRPAKAYTLLRGSCLDRLEETTGADIAVFSPPYPNSFDYTDIYNLELWVLGYLRARADNTRLRESTLRSHVQVCIPARGRPVSTPTLDKVTKRLVGREKELWDHRIPEMIKGYFSDLSRVLYQLRRKVRAGGTIAIVVGDSRYDDVRVPVATILAELARDLGYSIREKRTLRSMRSSAQQGGEFSLDETLLQLTR